MTGDCWGPLKGSLLNLSYGYGKIFVAPHEEVNGQVQGGMCELPLPSFPTGIMRGRFHPTDGQLYVCGMFAWAGNATQPGGFYRVRSTGKPVHLPIGLNAKSNGIVISFTSPLDPHSATDPTRYTIKTWGLKRSEKYGSDHYDERPSPVAAASLSDDGKTVFLTMPELKPTWCMEIKYSLNPPRENP
ncbi:MAG: hypothetical protein HY000_38455 [Planctomycetes bacterium]|nr:hypothetical protein [Planctomycetota bacterium]